MNRAVLLWILAEFLILGCAAAPPAIEKKDIAAPAVNPVAETPVSPPRLFEERNLLLEGVTLLNLPERPDPEKARSIFLSLIQHYPQSRWRPVAEAFIRLIDERDAFGEMSRRERLSADKTKTEQSRVLQENDNLKKVVRELWDKLQSETTTLAQENEQLKGDLKRLKALEIELQKRERMLR